MYCVAFRSLRIWDILTNIVKCSMYMYLQLYTVFNNSVHIINLNIYMIAPAERRLQVLEFLTTLKTCWWPFAVVASMVGLWPPFKRVAQEIFPDVVALTHSSFPFSILLFYEAVLYFRPPFNQAELADNSRS